MTTDPDTPLAGIDLDKALDLVAFYRTELDSCRSRIAELNLDVDNAGRVAETWSAIVDDRDQRIAILEAELIALGRRNAALERGEARRQAARRVFAHTGNPDLDLDDDRWLPETIVLELKEHPPPPPWLDPDTWTKATLVDDPPPPDLVELYDALDDDELEVDTPRPPRRWSPRSLIPRPIRRPRP